MPTLVDEDVVQAFRADGLHVPLAEGAGLRRSDAGADDPAFFRRLSSVSVTLRLADDPLLLYSVLERGDVARTTDSA